MTPRNSFRESHFHIWKWRVQHHVQNNLDVEIKLDDLPDESYRIWFEETCFTPKEVANYITNSF